MLNDTEAKSLYDEESSRGEENVNSFHQEVSRQVDSEEVKTYRQSGNFNDFLDGVSDLPDFRPGHEINWEKLQRESATPMHNAKREVADNMRVDKREIETNMRKDKSETGAFWSEHQPPGRSTTRRQSEVKNIFLLAQQRK